MDFEYIGNAGSVARNLLPVSIGLLVAGGGVLWMAVARDKSLMFMVSGVLLILIGGYYFHQSGILAKSAGEWRISVADRNIKWQSPDESIDTSFSIHASRIDHILVEVITHRGEGQSNTILILDDGSQIRLNDISGVNLEEFVGHLQATGVAVKHHRR